MQEKYYFAILRTVGIYLLFSALWILLSDQAIALVTNTPEQLTRLQTYKGLFFVVISGFLIFVLLHRELKQRELSWRSYQAEREEFINQIHQSNNEIRSAYDATIEGWARTVELRDRDTSDHSGRVVDLTLRLSQQMGIPEQQLQFIRWGALLHDIGKLGIPDHILLKPGRLETNERKVIEQHPEQGYLLLKNIEYLDSILDIPHYHHERWDGKGYPDGLSGENIPLPARVFAVVDVWDAMTTDRPYRPALSADDALAYIQEQSGKHFDPEVVAHFLNILQAEETRNP